jgi:PAS domain S-box-containing protein
LARKGARPELLALGAFLVAYASWFAIDWIPGKEQSLQIAFLAPVDALVVFAAWRASRRCGAVPWLRSFWVLLAVAWTVELVADLLLGLYDVVRDDPTFPSVADLFYLGFYPLLALALLRTPAGRSTRSQRLQYGLDCGTVVVGAGAAIWYFDLGHLVTEGGGTLLETAVAIGYQVGDLVLLAAFVLVLVRGHPPVLRPSLGLIGLGLALLITADTIYGHQQLIGSYLPGDPVDALFVLAAVPFALAAARQRRPLDGDPATEPVDRVAGGLRVSRLPLLALLGGAAVLLGTQSDDRFFPNLSLLLFMIVLGALTVGRQYVAQRELEQLRERLGTIVESVADGIVTFADNGRIVWVNAAAEQAFQVGPGELEGEPVDSLFEGVGWREMAPRLGVGGGGGKSVIGRRRTLTGRRRDGSSFPLEMIVTEARLGGERVLIAVGQDVGERERAALALRESESRFRGIFDHAGVGIVFSAFRDGRPRIVDANAAFVATVGYPLRQLRGDDFSLITHPDDLSDLAEMGAAVAAGDDYIGRELRCMRADGSRVWGSLRVSILRDDAGEPRYAIGMLEDVTRRKEAERIKDEFVSVVGHELRTPLTSIRGSLGLLEGGVMGELPEEAGRMISTAVSNTDRLVRLINDILDLERIDSRGDELELESVPAADLVEQSIQVVRGTADEAGVEVRARESGVEVLADPDRIVQALTNLLGNAIKFSEPGGSVEVGVERNGESAVFAVSDSGRGIPADRLGSIFERFEQVDASDAREKGGTGLGLAIVRGIVERHGGRIWAESGEGAGATLRFTLPLGAEGAR